MNTIKKTQVVEHVMRFAMITPTNIAIVETPEELWTALIYRSSYPAVIYASSDVSLLKSLVGQHAVPVYYGNVCDERETPRLAMPTDDVTYFMLEYNSATLNSQEDLMKRMPQHITPETIDRGCWAITGLNGFGLAKNIQQLISVVNGHVLQSAVAIWCQDWTMAYMKVRESYAKRFFQRYDYRHEQIGWIPWGVEGYLDEAFEQREQRRHINRMELFALYEGGY